MSQIRITFVVCVSAAALVALVSAQRWDGNSCSTNVQSAINKYNSQVQQEISQLVTKISKHGQDTANVDAIVNQANQIASQLSQAGNSENLTDVSKLTNIATSAWQSYLKLGFIVFRTESLTGAMSIWSEFTTRMLPLYTNLVSNMINACAPTSSN